MAAYTKNIDALNAIAQCLGGDGGHSGVHGELYAWQEIQEQGIFQINVPTNLTASRQSKTSILLSWSAPEGDYSGIDIYVSTTNNEYTLLHKLAGTSTSYLVESLIADTAYYFYIKAYIGSHQSDRSNKAMDITFDESISYMFYPELASDPNYVQKGAGDDQEIWWEVFAGKLGRGEEESSGNLIQWGIYEITACQTNYFFPGCVVGQVFSCYTVKALDSNNKVKRVLGNHVGQRTVANRPVNGVFDGLNDLIKSAPFTFNQPLTRYSILKQITWASTEILMDGATTGYCMTEQSDATPKIRSYAGAGTNYNSDFPLDTWSVLTERFNNTAGSAGDYNRINRNARVSTTVSGFGSRNPGGITFGASGGGTKWANCAFKLSLWRNAADSYEFSEHVITWMLSKLPASAPVLTASPKYDDTITLNATIGNFDFEEITWEVLNGVDWEVAAVTGDGISTIDVSGYDPNTTYNFRCKVKISGSYGDYSDAAEATTFRKGITFTVDTSVSREVNIRQLGVNTGKFVELNWGDGTDDVRIDTASVLDTQHIYPEGGGTYTFRVRGDCDQITIFEFFQNPHVQCDMNNWFWYNSLWYYHWYGNNHIGDVSTWETPVPDHVIIHHFGDNDLEGDMSAYGTGAEMRDFHVENNRLGGNIADFLMNHLVMDSTQFGHVKFENNQFDDNGDYIDLTGLTIPHGNVSIFNLGSSYGSNKFAGNLNSLVIEASSIGYGIEINMINCKFTGLPRGNFERIILLNYTNNACNQTEIDAFLAAWDTRLTDGIVPLFSAMVYLVGAGMGIPSAAGLASISSIYAKYTLAGKTCSISVNS